jgi:hypothetical protein
MTFPRIRLRLPSLSPTAWLALIVTAVGLAFVVVGVVSDWLDAWAPNLATSAFTIAVTVTVVERIVRREARERLRPRVESAMDALRQEFRAFLSGVTVDYAGTHLHTFRPLPRDALDFLDQWLEDKAAQDACDVPGGADDVLQGRPLVVYKGDELGKALLHYRELDRDVLEPEVVRAIDDYLWLGVQHSRLWFGLSPAERAKGYAGAETTIVRQARAFGEALARHDPRGRLTFEDLTLRAMAEHSENLRDRAREIAELGFYRHG